MKNKSIKRITALMTAVLMTAGIITGCGGAAPTGDMVSLLETTAAQSEESGAISSESTVPASEAAVTAEETTAERAQTDSFFTQNLSLKPTSDLGNGLIGCESSFLLTLEKEVPEKTLSELITLSPEMPFELTKQEENSFLMTLSEELPSGSLVRLGVKNGSGDSLYKWAFQTEEKFKVRQTYPSDGSDSAYSDTGIEITFNADIDPGTAKDYFTITPAVTGRFESHLSTLYFIPDKPLEENQNYKVTIKQGMPSKSNIALEESYTFEFKTSKDYSKTYCYTTDNTETFVPGDLTVVDIHCSDEYLDRDFQLDLYRIDSADSYMKSLAASKGSKEVSTEGLSKIYSEKSRLMKGGDYSNAPDYLMLPENMEEGWYLAEITTEYEGKSTKIQRHIQISTVSVYSASLPGQAQFFINDTETGNAAAGAKIELITENGSYTAETDSDGLALMDIPEGSSGRGILKITYNEKTYADIYRYSSDGRDDPRDSYFAYVFTDRETYLTSDTVNVWGVIRSRTKEQTLPEDLKLVFGLGSKWNTENDTALQSKDITLGKDGTFTAEFSYKDHIDTWGSMVALYSGETKLCSKYIRIHDFDKPLYTISTEVPDYAILYDDTSIPVEITAAFYDGTPAEGLEFNISDYNIESVTPEKIVTDKDGKAHAEVKFKDSNSSGGMVNSFNVSLAGVQDVYSNIYANVRTFSRDIIAEADWDKETGEVSFTANYVTLDNPPEDLDYFYYYYDFAEFKGAPADIEIKAQLTHSYSVKVEDGSHYDFLQKKNITDYKYEYKEEDLGTYTVNTVNGKAVIKDLPIEKNNGSYRLALSWKDSKGRETVTDYYPCGYDYSSSSETVYRYYIFSTPGENFNDTYKFKENEAVPFVLKRRNSEAVEKFEGRILFTVHGNDFTDSRIYTQSEFEYVMTNECIPNVQVCGAYFDGRHIYPVHEYWISYDFDPSERNISLEITSDKEKYLPGETAEITVKAAYEDGTPADGATVLLSVVDEAAFALGDQDPDILGRMYEWRYIPSVREYFSYIQHTLDFVGEGEKGGGGDEWTVRKDFKNTALFSESTSDSTGTAHFTVKLPDNLTTWRATAVAMKYIMGTESGKSSKVYAGDAKYPVVVTQPVFVTPIMPDSFHTTDDAVLAADIHGADTVSITVSGNGVNKTLTGKVKESLSFGKLPEGEYTALFKAEGTDGRDAAEYPFSVKETMLEVPVMMVSDISALNTSDSLRWPVRITFYNEEYMLYTDVLHKLSEYHGTRTDTNIAANYAMKEFGFMTEEDYLSTAVTFDGDGYVKLLDASAGDPELTARLLAAVPELMGSSRPTKEYYNILKNRKSTADEIAAAYLGLAALGEPVMIQIRNILSYDESIFEGLNKLKLIAALAVLGDCETANTYLAEYLSNSERKETPEGAQLSINGTDTLEYTKYALIAASAIGLPEADEMARYIVNTEYVYDTAAPELIYYLKHYNKEAESEASFSYKTDSGEKIVTLDRNFGTTLDFGEESFKKADFKAVSGSIRTYMYYMGRVTDINTGIGLNVTKSLSSDTGDYRPGSLVTVNITTSEPYCYVTDVIPSCGRYVDNNSYKCSKQTVTMYTNKEGKAQYQFRITVSGEFTAEGAYACGNNNISGFTETTTINVK